MNIFNKPGRSWPHVEHHAGPCLSMATIIIKKKLKIAFLETCCRQCSLLAMQPPFLLPPTRGMCLCVCVQMLFSLIFIYLPQQRGQKLNPEILAPLAPRCSSFISSWAFLTRSWDGAATRFLRGIREKRETLNLRRGFTLRMPWIAPQKSQKIPGCRFWEAPTLIQAMSLVAKNNGEQWLDSKLIKTDIMKNIWELKSRSEPVAVDTIKKPLKMP